MSELLSVLGFAGAFYAGMHLIIIVHELGHCLAARAFGVAIYGFQSGVGPVLARYVGRNCRFEIRLFPVAGGVHLVGVTSLPQRSEYYRAIAEELYSINPRHPGLNRNTWFRRKNIFARLGIIFAGPLFSALFGLFVVPFAIAMSQEMVSFSTENAPKDARCAAAVVCELELQDRGITDGELRLVYGGAEYVYPVVELARFREGSRLAEAYRPLEAFWKEQPEGILYFQHNQEPVVEMTFDEVIARHMVRLETHYREHAGAPEDPTFRDKLAFRTNCFFNTLEHGGSRRWGPETLWRKTLVGRIITDARVFWDNGVSDFFLFLSYLSVCVGLLNLIPLYPLDGGRILTMTLSAIGVRGKGLLGLVTAYYLASVLLALLLFLVLPVVYDLCLILLG